MFDIAWGELVVIGVVALVVIGPKELPGVLRAVGQWTVKIRRMASEFQSQFQEAMREAEMADLKKEVDTLTDTARGMTDFSSHFEESAKWEPRTEAKSDAKPDDTKPDDTKPVEAKPVETAENLIKPIDPSMEAASVTADGYVPEAAPAPAGEPHPAPAAAAPDTAPASAPASEGSGGGHS